METVSANIPNSAVIAAVFVLIYSSFCLSCGVLLVLVLYLSKERYSYVILFAISTTCSTTVNIIQQINYLANWHRLRMEQYEASCAAYGQPSLALGPLSKGFNKVLFWVVLYFYNVDSMLMLFWALALVLSVWNWTASQLDRRRCWLDVSAKIAAWILPALVIGLRKSYQLRLNFVTAVILLNILMLLSFTIGTICIIFILARYLRGRLEMSSYACSSSLTDSATDGTVHSSSWSRLTRRVDPWLIVRFTTAFIILSALEVFLVFFEIRRYNKIQKDAKMETPDFSAGATIADILNYIPGVTASLLAFLLFGTTKPLRAMYSTMFASLNPFRHTRSGMARGAKALPHGSDRELEDIEVYGMNDMIKKRVSVEVSIVDRSSPCNNYFDTHIRTDSGKWYPGAKIGILDDP